MRRVASGWVGGQRDRVEVTGGGGAGGGGGGIGGGALQVNISYLK